MEFEPPLTNSQTWQNALDPRLVRRLLRPLVQPGVIDSRLAKSIISRTERMTNRLPLLVHLVQRQAGVAEAFQAGQTPIVYAQPLPMVSSPVDSVQQPFNSASSQMGKPTVIQAKFADSTPSSDSLTHLSSSPDLPFTADSRSHPDPLATPQSQPPIANVPSLRLNQNTNIVQPSSLSAPQTDTIHPSASNPTVVQAQLIYSALPGSTDLPNLRSPLSPESDANAQVTSETTMVYAQPIGRNTNYESQVQRLNQSMVSGWSNASGELRSPPGSPAESHPVVRVSNGANPSAQPNGLSGTFSQPLVPSSHQPAIGFQRGAEIGMRGHQQVGMESSGNAREVRRIGLSDMAPAPGNQPTMMAQPHEPFKSVETTQTPLDLEALANKVPAWAMPVCGRVV